MSFKRRFGKRILRWAGLFVFWLIRHRVRRHLAERGGGRGKKRHYDYEVKK